MASKQELDEAATIIELIIEAIKKRKAEGTAESKTPVPDKLAKIEESRELKAPYAPMLDSMENEIEILRERNKRIRLHMDPVTYTDADFIVYLRMCNPAIDYLYLREQIIVLKQEYNLLWANEAEDPVVQGLYSLYYELD